MRVRFSPFFHVFKNSLTQLTNLSSSSTDEEADAGELLAVSMLQHLQQQPAPAPQRRSRRRAAEAGTLVASSAGGMLETEPAMLQLLAAGQAAAGAAAEPSRPAEGGEGDAEDAGPSGAAAGMGKFENWHASREVAGA